jgi:chitosanase
MPPSFRIAPLAFVGVLALAACRGGAGSEDPSGGESASTNKSPPPVASGPTTPPPAPTASPPSASGLDALAKHKAELLTSIWENGTTVLQYRYCENIGDGRGYTSGRAGFCSGTGDALLVVQCLGSSSLMAKYLPELQSLDQAYESTGKDQASTTGLDAIGGYCADWSAVADDATSGPPFRACQDKVVDSLYFQPALAQAKAYGLSTALAKAALYDAEINHGDDGVSDLAKQATTDAGAGSGARTLGQESAWLAAFLARRVALLKSDATWAQSVDRVANYEALRLAKNFDLSQAIETNAKAATLYPGQGLADSGYPDCVISTSGAVSGAADCTNPSP